LSIRKMTALKNIFVMYPYGIFLIPQSLGSRLLELSFYLYPWWLTESSMAHFNKKIKWKR
jgi:hypothetical protein